MIADNNLGLLSNLISRREYYDSKSQLISRLHKLNKNINTRII